MHVDGCNHLCICVGRSGQFSDALHFIFWDRISDWTWSSPLFWFDWLASGPPESTGPSLTPLLGWWTGTLEPGFYVDAGDLTSVRHAWAAVSLSCLPGFVVLDERSSVKPFLTPLFCIWVTWSENLETRTCSRKEYSPNIVVTGSFDFKIIWVFYTDVRSRLKEQMRVLLSSHCL